METRDRILIVDDDPEIRRLLVDYLTKNGFASHSVRGAGYVLAADVVGSASCD
jgi:DNA-binding response OmpR family regulator